MLETPAMQNVLSYIDAGRERFVDELAAWVKIPSISALPEHDADMAKNAIFILENEERLAAFKRNALAQAKTFDIENILPQYENYYNKVRESVFA